MNKLIIKALGGYTRDDVEREISEEVTSLRKLNSEKDKELTQMRLAKEALEIRIKKTPPLVNIDVGDPEPTDPKERAAYVARVSSDFDSWGEEKIRRMIAEVRELLDQPEFMSTFPVSATRGEYDWYLRGGSNVLKLLLEWGNRMRSENKANTTNNQ